MDGAVHAFLEQELSALARCAWGAFWRTLLVCVALGLALSFAADAERARAGVPSMSLLMDLVVGVGLGLFYGAPLAALAAAVAALWRLFGPSLLVVLVVAPLCALGVLWLFREPLSASAVSFLDSVIASARQHGLAHTAEAADGLRLGCSGGGVAVLFLVLLSPFLLADLGAILATAQVGTTFGHFAVAMTLALGAAAFAALLFASPVLLLALVRRGKRRFAAAGTAGR